MSYSYADAVAQRDAIVAAISSNAGALSFQIGDRVVRYDNLQDRDAHLARLTRDIREYEKRASGVNPRTSRVKWRR